MKLLVTEIHNNRYISISQAVEKCSASTEEILGTLIEILWRNSVLTASEISEILCWDFSIEVSE